MEVKKISHQKLVFEQQKSTELIALALTAHSCLGQVIHLLYVLTGSSTKQDNIHGVLFIFAKMSSYENHVKWRAIRRKLRKAWCWYVISHDC